MQQPSSAALWGAALCQPAVWRRAFIMALSVGIVQVAINQGDSWLSLRIDTVVIAKTLLTPLVTFAVSLFSAAGAYVDRGQKLSVDT